MRTSNAKSTSPDCLDLKQHVKSAKSLHLSATELLVSVASAKENPRISLVSLGFPSIHNKLKMHVGLISPRNNARHMFPPRKRTAETNPSKIFPSQQKKNKNGKQTQPNQVDQTPVPLQPSHGCADLALDTARAMGPPATRRRNPWAAPARRSSSRAKTARAAPRMELGCGSNQLVWDDAGFSLRLGGGASIHFSKARRSRQATPKIRGLPSTPPNRFPICLQQRHQTIPPFGTKASHLVFWFPILRCLLKRCSSVFFDSQTTRLWGVLVLKEPREPRILGSSWEKQKVVLKGCGTFA